MAYSASCLYKEIGQFLCNWELSWELFVILQRYIKLYKKSKREICTKVLYT